MAGKSIMDRIQATIGIARAELVVLLFVLGGLTAGVIIKFVLTDSTRLHYPDSAAITRLLDSLALEQAKTYTGVNDTTALAALKSEVHTTDSATAKYSAGNLPTAPVNINTATKEALMKLPGIGPKTADAIIEYRNGKPFRKISQLMEIKGIGEKKFEKVKSFIDVK